MKSQTIAHGNDQPPEGNAREDIPLREALTRDFAEARILVDRVYREFHENGGLLEIERLLEKHRDLPWYLLKSAGETTESK